MGLPDVAIAGAGIVGAACAAEFASAGLRVAVVESAIPGGGATSAGMGHLAVMDDSPAQLALTSYSRRLWAELAADLPAEAQYSACGCVWVAADEEEMSAVRRKQSLYDGAGVKTVVLDSKALSEAEPNLRSGLAGGLLVEDDAVVYAPAAARFLLERACDQGASLRAGRAIDITGAGIRLSDRSFVSAGFTVDATGAWSRGVPGLEIRKRKGHLAITGRYPGFVHHQLIELGYVKNAHAASGDSVAFNVQPRMTGQMLVGSTRQFGVEDAEVDRTIVFRMLRRAFEYLPGLAETNTIRIWTGFRAATPDDLPLIGPSPDDGRLYFAAGHEGLGITTSLATAKLIASRILGRASEIPIEPYLPGRRHA
jgi:glycine/D-amino acid oxidase-like deaminating enzyme